MTNRALHVNCHDAGAPRLHPFARFVLHALQASDTTPADLRRMVCAGNCIAVLFLNSTLVDSPEARMAERAAAAAGWPYAFAARGVSLEDLQRNYEPDSPEMQDVNDYVAGKWPGQLLIIFDSGTTQTLGFVSERPAGRA